MDKQYVEYSNLIEFNGRKLAFKKKMLYDITESPCLINQTDQGWWVSKKLLSKANAKNLVREVKTVVDISDLQWYNQIELQECIKLT